MKEYWGMFGVIERVRENCFEYRTLYYPLMYHVLWKTELSDRFKFDW